MMIRDDDQRVKATHFSLEISALTSFDECILAVTSVIGFSSHDLDHFISWLAWSCALDQMKNLNVINLSVLKT